MNTSAVVVGRLCPSVHIMCFLHHGVFYVTCESWDAKQEAGSLPSSLSYPVGLCHRCLFHLGKSHLILMLADARVTCDI